jgi:pyruvate kinase
MRFTKIICTLGPASSTKEKIAALADAGMNVARINFSHGEKEGHGKVIAMVQELNAEYKKKNIPKCIAVLLDTKGPEVRTGDRDTPLQITKGQEVVFSAVPLPSEKRPVIIVQHDKFAEDVPHAENILVDNGESSFSIVSIEKNGSVVTTANDDATIGSRRHVNLPGARLTMPSITEKDWGDLEYGAKVGVDFVALSFVREAQEVDEVRGFLLSKKCSAQVFAKIETREAVDNIESIIQASDGIMVARGDLGAELPFERIPVIQDRIVALCKAQGKPVIVATHMLESMISKPMPTRAEVTDIAHAATTAADSTMLSGETASGKYPLAALDAMHRVLVETETHAAKSMRMEQQPIADEREARAEAAVKLAISIDAKALVVMTKSGKTALDVCKFRPRLPIIAFTDTESVQHHLTLSFGVIPLELGFVEDPEENVSKALERIRSLKLLQSGDKIVLVSDTRVHDLTVNTVQVRSI